MNDWMKYLKAWLLFLLLIVSGDALASAGDDFSQGLVFFKLGEYSRALEKFESARREGVRTSDLYYHIGRAYYKLEDYENAKDYFIAIRNAPKMNSLAEYNLGLVALKLNQKEKAIEYFKSVVKKDKDQKFVYLSRKRLRENDSLEKPWSLYASVKLGYDENINVAPEDIALDVSDSYLDTVVSLDYQLEGGQGGSWIGDVSFYRTNYFETGVYDQDKYGIGVKRTQRIADWVTHCKLSFDELTYGLNDYQSVITLDVRGGTDLADSDVLYLSYRYEEISSDLVKYDYLQGWRQKFRAEFRQYNNDNKVQLYYELEVNNRQDLVLISNEYSYSPTRHTLRGKYTKILDAAWRLTSDLSYRVSDYPTTVVLDRQDDRWKAALYVDYQFAKNMRLMTTLEYTHNDSTESLYDYDRTLIMLGLSKLF